MPSTPHGARPTSLPSRIDTSIKGGLLDWQHPSHRHNRQHVPPHVRPTRPSNTHDKSRWTLGSSNASDQGALNPGAATLSLPTTLACL